MHRLFTSPPKKKMIKLVNKAYAEQSQFAHSSFIAIFSEFVRHLDRKKEYLKFLRFDRSFISEGLSTPLSILLLVFLIDLYQDELEKSFRVEVMNLVDEKLSEWKSKGLLKN